MICLTDLRGGKTRIHTSLIREIKKVPDTVVIMTNGNSLFVQESIDSIVDMIAGKRSI